jgi:hypothetical protein
MAKRSDPKLQEFYASGAAAAGMSLAQYTKEIEVQNQLFKEQNDLVEKLQKKGIEATSRIREQGKLQSYLNGSKLEEQLIAEKLEEIKDKSDLTQEDLDGIKQQVTQQKKLGKAVNEIFPGAISFATGIEDAAEGMSGLLGPAAIAAAIFVALAKLALGYAKAVADTRKELGVSVVTATKLNTQNRILGLQAKLYGLDVEDIKNAQASIRQDLGASVQEAASLSLNFARTAAATGQSSEELAKTLSLMESISSSSRDVLLNQIKTNAAMIEAAGVAPALVMKDLATNAGFFAEFAKDGGMNIINAGVAARKLGLEMSAVASISNSLLDFETSIEDQMTASLLLGRQINLDKARQLALAGDQEGVMKEILKAVGGEAEFNKMNVIQRRALAKSVGVEVEQLSRLVRNNTAGATGAAIGAAAGAGSKDAYPIWERMGNDIHTMKNEFGK